MNEPAPTTAPAETADAPRQRGYFNQAQLADVTEAEAILAAARQPEHTATLQTQQIDATYLDGLADALLAARRKITETGEGSGTKKSATLRVRGTERTLVTALQSIQSAAKQKRRMLDEDDDPTTNFSTEGYLIGRRLNPNRPTLLQNADALLAKATADDLPGHPPERIAEIDAAKAAFRDDTAHQADTLEETATDRIERDKLVRKINSRRYAIQNAADRLYPYWNDDLDPTRRLFKLPVDRPFNG